MKKKIACILLACLCLAGCARPDRNIRHYLHSGRDIDKAAADVLPDLGSLPAHKSISYEFYSKPMLIYQPQSMVLVVSYDEETYASEKEKLDGEYAFLDHCVANEDMPAFVLIPEYEFDIKSFHFRVVDDPDMTDAEQYPKFFGMVATSDEQCSIAYLYFYNPEQDYICYSTDEQDMTKFMEDYFQYPW